MLGDHVHQAGSLDEPDRLRFDFTHFSALTPEELTAVTEMVNRAILDGGYAVHTDVMPIEEAHKLRRHGAVRREVRRRGACRR